MGRSMTRIQLVLSDDWELRGNGSGAMRAIQFATLRGLREIYEATGLRGSFNAEVMQQLEHQSRRAEFPELGELADEWDDIVRETYAAGHDVQLHVHPQWSDAVYEDGGWSLRGSWSILDYPREELLAMLARCKDYLEALLRPIDPGYRCLTFRSGSWCIAPGRHVLDVLVELGIEVDVSIADGIHSDTRHVKLDYRELDEPFLPYYPELEDARRIAAGGGPIVAVPTHTFRRSVTGRGLRFAGRAAQRRAPWLRPVTRALVAPSDTPVPRADYDRRAYFEDEWGTIRRAASLFSVKVSDLSELSYLETRQMLRDVRRRARGSGWPVVPVVIENHTKDLGDLEPLRLFAREVARSDFEVITLAELARNIRDGMYPIRTADGRRRTAPAPA
jgi:hypothetical protein